MEFMKNNLVIIDDANLTKIFDKSLSLDLRNKLIEYEIEYSFYCAEDKTRANGGGGGCRVKCPSKTQNKQTLSSNGKKQTSSETETNGKTTKSDQVENDTQQEDDPTNREQIVEKSLHESTSEVADATATVIIQHLLANNHLRSLRSNYTY